jgi:hypothetical protein
MSVYAQIQLGLVIGFVAGLSLIVLALGAALNWLTAPAPLPKFLVGDEPPVFTRVVDTHRCARCREPRTESDLMRVGDSYICREGCDERRVA